MGKEKRRVANTVQAKKTQIVNSNSPLINTGALYFDFSYQHWLKSTSIKDFTNMLKDDSQFSQSMIEIFNKIFPTVVNNWGTIKKNGAIKQFPHCHTISDSSKIRIIESIIQNLYGKNLLDDIGEDLNYWQLGISQSLRVIGIYNHITNLMYPIFLDHHHQIYPSVKYNADDIGSYKHCTYSKYS